MAQSRGRAQQSIKGQRPRADDQGFTEILIVIALVAITAIGVVSLFGEQIEELFSGKAPEATAPARPSPSQQGTSAASVAAPGAPDAAPGGGKAPPPNAARSAP